MLYLSGIIITLFLAILLAGKKNKSRADLILLVWLVIIGLHLLQYYIFISGKSFDFPFLLGVHIPFPLFHGPLLFLYTVSLTQIQKKFLWTWWLHFLPILALYLFLIPFFRLLPEEKIAVYKNEGAGYETIIRVSLAAIILSGVGYVTASLVLLRRYRKRIENEFSNIDRINLAWLRYLIYGLAVIWFAVILGSDPLIFGITVAFVFLLGYFGIRQTSVFSLAGSARDQQNNFVSEPGSKEGINVTETDLPQQVTPATRAKYEKSGLGEEQARIIHEKLHEAMTGKKLFSEPEITLAALSKILDVHPNHLSQVINSIEGKNFFDYINMYRVEEFKRLAALPGSRNYTLLSLAFECGFNSKTSFNRNFRKATGISPSEYLLQQQITIE